MRLALGTANFGQQYGIANQSGKLELREVASIVRDANAKGINDLDTAIAYGESESVLGSLELKNWRVVSKLPPFPNKKTDPRKWVESMITQSLEKLKLRSLGGVLLHNPEDLQKQHGNEIYLELKKLQENGLVEKIGISIYNPKELEEILPRYSIDIIQAPFNILDTRLEKSGWLHRLNESGIEVQARSVFLQGLLLMQPGNRPRYFNRWNKMWLKWKEWVDENQTTPLRACLKFVLHRSEFRKIVVGVDSSKQMKEILSAVAEEALIPIIKPMISRDEDLITPSKWGTIKK